MLNDQELTELKDVARQCRRDIVRMTHKAGSGHPGGSLSAIAALVVLYLRHMRVRPQEPLWHERDMFFLSKGHCTPAYYAVMAARGYFPREELLTFRALGTRLQGHPSNTHLPGVDSSSGSLGQGLSVANGAALARAPPPSAGHPLHQAQLRASTTIPLRACRQPYAACNSRTTYAIPFHTPCFRVLLNTPS